MKDLIRRAGILLIIFAAALCVLFFVRKRQMEQDEPVYVAMEQPSLPIVTVDMYGRKMNRMAGYCQDMGNAAAEDSLTILPENRVLPVYVAGRADGILGVSYEIRSLDLSRLVENTRIETWEKTEDGILVHLPIQNLLAKERQYQLRIQLDTEQHGPVYYYTRILWTDHANVSSMIDMAADFSSKTFDAEQAKSLVRYLETSPTEDNSSLGRTGIRSSFHNLTWGNLEVQILGTVQVKLKELDGTMGCVQLDYLVSQDDENGAKEIYEVSENFTLKWNQVRTYLMDYERYLNQVFQGKRSDYAGKRILLGITNSDRIEVKRSPDQKTFAYRTNRELWTYRGEERNHRAVKVFSFRGSDLTDVRNNDPRHDIRILNVDNEGNVDFLVYGYMNRGRHEGQMGIVGYRYDVSGNALEELFFICSDQSFAALKMEVDQLAYRTSGDMLYLLVNHAIYGIDLKSRENMVVADALKQGSYCISRDGSRIAWQEGTAKYESAFLHMMNLETGEKHEIHAGSGEYVRVLGFVGDDLVYGIGRAEDLWVENGRVKSLPMHTVHIVNDRLEKETSYGKPGCLVSDVKVEESRVHLERVARSGSGCFQEMQEDTIVCNADMGPGPLADIGWYASDKKGRIYFVQLDQEIKSSRNIHLAVPKKISYGYTDVLELKSNYESDEVLYYAYGGGRLLGITPDFYRAVELAYERMGIVTDSSHRLLWGRVNRRTVRILRDPQEAWKPVEDQLETSGFGTVSEAGITALDARGCSLQQVLYFVDKGLPVIGYTGEERWVMIYGFDQYNITIFDPFTGSTYKSGLNDSTEYFRTLGNDFVCGVQFP